MTILPPITHDIIASAMDYDRYRLLVEQHVANGTTSGPQQTEVLHNYTKINLQRMKRVEQTAKLTDETQCALQAIHQPMLWLTLTEAWCGDAAQIVPLVAAMAEINSCVQLRFLLRDEHLPIMDDFLTNGGRSIPKLIFLNPETLAVLGSWGPRPTEAQTLVTTLKAADTPFDELAAQLHKWYAADKTLNTQRSFIAALQAAQQVTEQTVLP